MAIVIQQGGGVVRSGGVYRLTTYKFLDGQMGMQSVNFQVTISSGSPTDDLGSLLQAYALTSVTLDKSISATAATLVGWKLACVSQLPPDLPGIVTDGVACTGGATPVPTQVSGIIQALTLKAGRAYRGRIFVPFPWIAAVDTDQTPTAAYVTALNTWANTVGMVNQLLTVGGNVYQLVPVIWHRHAGKTGIPLARTYDIMTEANARKEWGTQRKRGDLGRLNVNFIT
jgi:hypothetical protein